MELFRHIAASTQRPAELGGALLRTRPEPTDSLSDLPLDWQSARTESALPPQAMEVPHTTSKGPALDAVIISDIHLGCDNCQAKLVTNFLEEILDGRIVTRRLIINGDVFDSIDFRRLKKTHWKVLSTIRHLSDKMDVIWTCGNHDGPAEIISHLLGVQVRDEYIFISGSRRMLVLHGHIFDDFIDDHPILTWIGDVIYNTLQHIDRRHYIARLAKARSKVFLHCLAKVQRKSIAYARRLGCDAVMCGHTHHSAAVTADGDNGEHGIDYFNSGCWTELPPTWLAVQAGKVTVRTYLPESVPQPSATHIDLVAAAD